MDELQLNGPLSRRRFQTSLLTGILGLGTLGALGSLPTEAEAACSVTANRMMQAVIGPGGKLLRQYCDPLYRGYSKPVDDPVYGHVYVRHTGRDFSKAPGSPVRAVAAGRVTGIMNPHSPPRWQAAVVYDGGSTWWIYGHLNLAVRVGQVINRGQIVGTIADPGGLWSPHVHVGAYKIPMPTRTESVQRTLSWGRAYGRTGAEAQASALRYTVDPLVAFARTLGEAC
ncbi:M23 family metallopeptidase [Benzoatithermus flavus]|uniref:M23 family metallopeptidase n=1 Tax=Benzoatithermus flavus TaxID=3108223 RepID=A0ABU8XS43_9PROT